MSVPALFGAGVLLAAVTAAGAAVLVYNGLIAAQKECSRAWANVDVLLKQRHDELPRLVEVCRGHMDYERSVLSALVEARNRYAQAHGLPAVARASESVSGALHRLFALSEAYPALASDASFAKLRERITGLEDRIADRRELYNAAATEWNARIEQVPDLVLARAFAMRPRDLWRGSPQDRVRPPVAFAPPPENSKLKTEN